MFFLKSPATPARLSDYLGIWDLGVFPWVFRAVPEGNTYVKCIRLIHTPKTS